ncbi:MAG: methyl-accepting chemotaxis protein, partial [Anaerovibrio sp.]|nr:methyl-accepting chemotaxis protein [Anaerovibrio sp.]
MGHYQLQLRNMATSINETAMHVSAAMEELAASANDVNENQKGLNKEIENVSTISSKINEFTNLIRDIAKQTRLLGLNASIEAARAGTAGAGFAVVSEEIGKLADSSRETVDKIQEFTSQIGESVNETVSKGEATSEIVGQQTAAIAEVAQELTNLSETAGRLVTLANHK